jgi:hypothetical protein
MEETIMFFKQIIKLNPASNQRLYKERIAECEHLIENLKASDPLLMKASVRNAIKLQRRTIATLEKFLPVWDEYYVS